MKYEQILKNFKILLNINMCTQIYSQIFIDFQPQMLVTRMALAS